MSTIQLKGARALACVVVVLAIALSFAPSIPLDSAYAGNVVVTTAAKKATAAKKTFPIIYKLNGGTQASKQVRTIAAGKTIKATKLKKPKRKGYVFLGWYANKKLNRQATTLSGASAKSKRTVYAKWVKSRTCKIKYQLNGGKLYGSYVKSFSNAKAVKKLPTPSKALHVFDGWYSNKKLTKRVDKIEKGARGDVTLYAKWTPLEFSIAYIVNGGTMPDAYATTYDTDTALTKLPMPKKPGYSFMGWYSDRNFTNYVGSIPKASKGNKLLYAKWRKRVLVAHRGLVSEEYPENSIGAFRNAYEHGFEEIETDIRFTSDGVPILCHDASVPLMVQVGDGTWEVEDHAVSEFTYEELQRVPLMRVSTGEDGRNFATLEEALQACVETGMWMTLHMKEPDNLAGTQTLVELVGEYGMGDNVRWFSSSVTALGYVLESMPGAHIVFSHDLTAEGVKVAASFASSAGDVMINKHKSGISSAKLKLCKEAGIAVRTHGYKDETKLVNIDQYISSVLVDAVVAECVPEVIEYE